MKKNLIAAVFVLGIVAGPALADEGFDPGHIILANASSDPVPVETFSQQEAQLWVLNAGYSQVSDLHPDGRYLYRGTAMMNGDTYDIVVDALGNILGSKE